MNKGMKKHVSRAAACFVTGALLVTGSSIAAMATGSSLVGVETVESKTEENVAKKESKKSKKAKKSAEKAETVEEVQEEVVEQQPSMVGSIAVALPGEEEFFNIRSSASTESDVVGYLYDNNFATIIGEEDDWYIVQSGNCVGYVAKHLLTTGAEAAEAIRECMTPVAQVNASALMIRSDASEDAEVLDMISENDIVYLEEDLGGWAKVSNGTTTGYVNADYVSYATYLPQGESHAEAEVRVAQEEAAYAAWVAEQEAAYAAWVAEQEQLYLEALAAEQAEWEAQNQAWIEYLQSQGEYADQTQAAADAAGQMYEDANSALSDAYENGDADEIAAAEQAYQEAADAYMNAQAEADAADQSFNDAVANAGIDSSVVESQEDSSGSTSSQRQAIVDYALQFVGNPYVYGGTSLTNGTDCSGFTQGVLGNFGININRTAGQQAQGGKDVDLSNIQPGDLLFYSGDGDYGIGHVSMYIGNGQVVHASSSTTGIIVSDINYRTPTSASNYID